MEAIKKQKKENATQSKNTGISCVAVTQLNLWSRREERPSNSVRQTVVFSDMLQLIWRIGWSQQEKGKKEEKRKEKKQRNEKKNGLI